MSILNIDLAFHSQNSYKEVDVRIHALAKIIIGKTFVCLFELMLYVPVNNNGHVGTLPPF